MTPLERLKAAVTALDSARAEHSKRCKQALARMENKMEMLGEAGAFVGLSASREAAQVALEELEAAAREVVK